MPELELAYVATGRYSTLEGIVSACLPSLQKVNLMQDSSAAAAAAATAAGGASGAGESEKSGSAWERARARLDSLLLLERGKGFVVEIRDPSAQSFVSGARDEAVANITEESYELSAEEREVMGLGGGGDGDENGGRDRGGSDSGGGGGAAGASAAAAAAAIATPHKSDARQEDENRKNRKMMKALNALAAEFTKEYDDGVGGGERKDHAHLDRREDAHEEDERRDSQGEEEGNYDGMD